MNSKIENGYARVIDSRVAESLGVTEAFILQQIRYWIEKSNHFVNDKYWTYHTYHEWHEQLPFFSEMTIRRAIKHLEETGIVLSGRFNKMGGDKTKWYSVDEDKLNEWLSHLTYKANAFAVNDMLTVHNEQSTVQNEQTTVQDEQDKLPLSVQDEQSNTNRIHIKDYNKECQENQINCLTRTASHAHVSKPYDFWNLRRQVNDAYAKMDDRLPFDIDCFGVLEFYINHYQNITGKVHPKMEQETVDRIVRIIQKSGIEESEFKQMIKQHFETDYGIECDYHAPHFFTKGITENQYYSLQRECY